MHWSHHNKNVNANTHRNVDVDVHHHGGYYGGGCCYHDNYHPIATAAAVTAMAMVTSAIIGSIVKDCPVGLQHGRRERLRLPAVRQHVVPAADRRAFDDLHRRQPRGRRRLRRRPAGGCAGRQEIAK